MFDLTRSFRSQPPEAEIRYSVNSSIYIYIYIYIYGGFRDPFSFSLLVTGLWKDKRSLWTEIEEQRFEKTRTARKMKNLTTWYPFYISFNLHGLNWEKKTTKAPQAKISCLFLFVFCFRFFFFFIQLMSSRPLISQLLGTTRYLPYVLTSGDPIYIAICRMNVTF